MSAHCPPQGPARAGDDVGHQGVPGQPPTPWGDVQPPGGEEPVPGAAGGGPRACGQGGVGWWAGEARARSGSVTGAGNAGMQAGERSTVQPTLPSINLTPCCTTRPAPLHAPAPCSSSQACPASHSSTLDPFPSAHHHHPHSSSRSSTICVQHAAAQDQFVWATTHSPPSPPLRANTQEIQHAYHTSGLLIKLLITQAESNGHRLRVDTSSLENEVRGQGCWLGHKCSPRASYALQHCENLPWVQGGCVTRG